MKMSKKWFIWAPIILVVMVVNVFSAGNLETGVELGYFNQSTIYGENPGSEFNYTVEVSSPPFVFPTTFNMLWMTAMDNFGCIYPRGFLRYRLNDFLTAGVNVGYLKDSFKIIDYANNSAWPSSRWGDYDNDSVVDDLAYITYYSTSTANRSISIIPIMGEINLSVIKRESVDIIAGISLGVASIKVSDEIDIENSLVEQIDYDFDATINVTNRRRTANNYIIESTKILPMAEVSLSGKTDINQNLSVTIGAGIQLLQADIGYKKQEYDDLAPRDWEFGRISLSGLHLFGGLSVKF